jgi:hypothetical protein
MLLVHQRKANPRVLEVAWTWVPFWLAADKNLIAKIDQELTKQFKGQEMTPDLLVELDKMVKSKILEAYKIQGLDKVLEALGEINLGDGL